MTIKSIQKVITIGSSAGVTIPVRDLKHADIEVGDEVEITVHKSGDSRSTMNDEVINTAKDILDRYNQDFKNLANR